MAIDLTVEPALRDLRRRTAEFVRDTVVGQWKLVATRELPGLVRLYRALESSIPGRSAAAIVHGDFRVDNAILDPEDPGRVSGRDLAELPFYLALAYFKIAVIAEGVHRRHLKGDTVGSGFDGMGTVVPTLVRAGLATLALDPRTDR